MAGVSGRRFPARYLELPDSPHRIIPMEGLRGFAVFLVFLVHSHAMFHKYLDPQSALYALSFFGHGIGNSGVDLFFVLSGYLIYGAVLSKPIRFLPFLQRRIQRIYPAFTAVFLGYVAVCWFLHVKIPHAPLPAAAYIAENYFLLPGLCLSIVPLISVAWSLSYEFFFYLLIPVLVALLGMRGWSRTARVAFFGAVFAVHMCVQYVLQARTDRIDAHPRLSMFIAGILLYEFLQSDFWKTRWRSRLPKAGEWFVMLLLCGAFPFVAHIGDDPKHSKWLPGFPPSIEVFWTVTLFITFFCLVLYAIAGGGFLARILSWTPLRRLGNMSYSYYLLHGAVLQGFALAVGAVLPPRPSALIFAASFFFGLLITLAAAFVLFILVEKPYSLAPRQPRAVPAVKPALQGSGLR